MKTLEICFQQWPFRFVWAELILYMLIIIIRIFMCIAQQINRFSIIHSCKQQLRTSLEAQATYWCACVCLCASLNHCSGHDFVSYTVKSYLWNEFLAVAFNAMLKFGFYLAFIWELAKQRRIVKWRLWNVKMIANQFWKRR